jgi:hypothetical protein
MLKKLIRLVVQLFVFILFLVVLLFGLLQTEIVKDKVKDILVSELNKTLNGEIYISQIRGNFINFLQIGPMYLKVNGDILFYSDGAKIKVKPLALLKNKIIVSGFSLYNPNINLEQLPDGKWNYAMLLTSKPDTSTSSKSTLDLNLANIELVNAKLRYKSYSDIAPDSSNNNSFNTNDIALENLNLYLDLNFNENVKTLNLNHLSCAIDNNNILKELFAKINIDEKGIQIDTMDIKYNSSILGLSLHIDDLNIAEDTLNLQNLKNKNLSMNLSAKDFDFNIVKFFVPKMNMVSGNCDLNLSATGNLEDLQISKLSLGTTNSNLNATGNIYNIYNLDDMRFDIRLSNSEFDLADLQNHLQTLDLPEFPNMGKIKLEASYIGKITNFNSDLLVEGIFGKVDGKLSLNLDKMPTYKLLINGHHLNLSPILGNNFDSKLNCKILASGRGLNINSINAELDVTIDSSRFCNQAIDKSRISVAFLNKRCNTLIAFAGDETKIGLHAEFNANPTGDQPYSLNLSIDKLDLSKFTNDNKFISNINISSACNGKYLSIDNTTGSLYVYIFPSLFQKDIIPEMSFNIKYDQIDKENKKFSLYSELADIDIIGKCDVKSLSTNLLDNISLLLNNVLSAFPFPSKTDVSQINSLATTKENDQKLNKIIYDTIDLSYNLHLKQLDVIKPYLDCKDIVTNIKASGKLFSNHDKLSFLGKASVDNLFYLSSENNILIQDLLLDYNISAVPSENMLFNMDNKISLIAPTIYYNKNTIKNLNSKMITDKNKTSIALNGNLNANTNFKLNGLLELRKEVYNLTFSELYVNHSGYVLNNNSDIACAIKNDGVDIHSFSLSHKNQDIILEGNISKSGEQTLSFLINNLRIETILALNDPEPSKKESSFLTGKINMRGEIFGNANDPIMNIYLKTDSLSTNYNYLGSLFGNVHYEDELLYTNIQFQSSGSESIRTSDMVLIGTVPLNLTLQEEKPLFPEKKEIDMYLVTNKLPLRLVSLVFPELDDITGNADINVRVYGTGNAPKVEGYANINKGNLTLLANGLTYSTQARMDITTDDIKFNAFIDNLPADNRNGRIEIKGLVKMPNLNLENVDANVKGELTVLKSKTKSNNDISGDLTIGITGDGISYVQNFKNDNINNLTGNIVIKDANLIMPLPNQNNASATTDEYRFIIIDDTSAVVLDSTVIKKLLVKKLYENFIANDQGLANTTASTNKLSARLNIRTLGNVKIEIPMDPLYGEALIAEIGGNFTFVKTGDNFTMYGSAEIDERSFYRFASKRFSATGRINFSGPINDPELNIRAMYSGTRTNKEIPGSPREEEVLVTIIMTGTLSKPITNYELTVDNKARDKGDIFSDIISFVLTGTFADEMTTDQKQSLADTYKSSLYSIGSGVISGKLTEFFKNEFEFIRSVETEYSGELASTNVRISGEIGNTAIFRFGGKVFSDITNANINLELSVGKITNNESLRNLIFEIYRNSNESTTKNITKQIMSIYGTKVFYRFNF